MCVCFSNSELNLGVTLGALNMDTGTDPSYVTRNKKQEIEREMRINQDTGLEGFGPRGKRNVNQTPPSIYYEYKLNSSVSNVVLRWEYRREQEQEQNEKQIPWSGF